MEEALIKRVMPHSVEAEQSVVGAMLMDKDAITTASEIISGQDFYQTSYGVVFDSMVELFNEGKPVDLVTLQNRLREKDVPPEVSSLDFVRVADFCHMTWISAWSISNMFKFGCSLCFQVLIKSSAVCYIDCLTAFADAQNRFTQFFTGVDQIQIELVYFQINKAKFINWLFSI